MRTTGSPPLPPWLKANQRFPVHPCLPESVTQRKLLLSAMHVFAEQGLNGVSMRAITKVAGALNTSAIHYHFKSKQGLLEALINTIQDYFDGERTDLQNELQARHLERRDLRSVLNLFATPYGRIIAEEPWGLSALRFLARVEADNPPEVSELLNRRSRPVVDALLAMLAQCLPELDDRRLRRRVNFVASSIIQGLANSEHLRNSYFGDVHPGELDNLLRFYTGCGEAVLLAPPEQC